MQQVIRGKAFVVGDNIDTDQIIPAEYLSYNPSDPAERKYFGRYAMSGVPVGAVGPAKGRCPLRGRGSRSRSEFAVIIGGRNFGCGSSREHAPLAIAEAGVQGRRGRELRPHLLPQQRQRRLPRALRDARSGLSAASPPATRLRWTAPRAR